jgi:hypothetical protein
MRTTLTRALAGLGLAGALFLGAGAAVAQTADDSSSSSSTTTAQDSQSTQSSNQNGADTAADCPEGPTPRATAPRAAARSGVLPARSAARHRQPRRGRVASFGAGRRVRASRGA